MQDVAAGKFNLLSRGVDSLLPFSKTMIMPCLIRKSHPKMVAVDKCLCLLGGKIWQTYFLSSDTQ